MTPSKVIQGNTFTLQIALKADGVAYPDLAAADSVTCFLSSLDGNDTLTVADSDPNVTVDSPATGSVTWTLTSAQTDALATGLYNLAVQSVQGVSKLEWVDNNAVEIYNQRIA